ncbi:XRE family transcriptional regulator [Rhodovarius crocodyli]|uniref:XRE family transcriptional regulator n=1 Tax=Rhodovarius crocodyli TaxID=1979269 RepID=A0A437MF97_9PROT|nr:XRE family transcriptional regulator [Rhodovarius crocodyli]
MSTKRSPWPELAARIRALREKRGLSLKEVGSALGISYVAMWKVEDGRTMPSAWQTRRLCEIYDISADELLGLAEERAATCVRNRSGTPSSISSASNSASERQMT